MKHIHFIAIGGAAMHNLALAVNSKQDYVVTGSDDEIFDPAKTRLEQAGILPQKIGWDTEQITSDLDAVIVGMHAREDNPELLKAKELNIPIYSFPEYLYEQTSNKTRIVVGGSHGKTTTTAIILYVLKQLGIEADYMVGAQIEGFQNMVRLSDTAKYAVFEGDEYLTSPLDKRSKFHLYHPHIAILTGIAWDHINVFPTFPQYVETFRKFAGLIEKDAKLIYFDSDNNLCEIARTARADIQTLPYNTPKYQIKNDIWNIELNGQLYPLNVFGEHNLQNLHAAQLACEQIGVSAEQFYTAIEGFTGASNRLELIAKSDNAVAFKDFAHSPSKLQATINAVKQQYADKTLIAALELHTFSSLNADFLPQYHNCMQQADVAFVYFNPKVIEHKRLQPITAVQVKEAFATENVQVFTEQQQLIAALKGINYQDTALLLMSSGTFDGLNIKQFAQELLQDTSNKSRFAS